MDRYDSRKWVSFQSAPTIGASNVEQLMGQMQRYRGSLGDLDDFVVPTVPVLIQQQDTIATLVEPPQGDSALDARLTALELKA